MDRSPALCCDSITRIRADFWSCGRIGLVGDAGCSPTFPTV